MSLASRLLVLAEPSVCFLTGLLWQLAHERFGTWPYLSFRHPQGLLPESGPVCKVLWSPGFWVERMRRVVRSILSAGLFQAESVCHRSVECQWPL